MSHELIRLKNKLYNTPHLIDATSFETILEYLTTRNLGGWVPSPSLMEDDDFVPTSEDDNDFQNYDADLQTGFINIEGPLTYKPVTIMGFDCGGANYQTIKSDFVDMIESGVKTVVLSIDSGGGEAFQCFPTAQYMRDLANENDVKIITYVDGLAASAAYALASIADEIIMAPSAEVGSIGVLVRLINDSKALEMNGYERTFVKAGGEKIPYAEDGSFRKEFIADIQEKVDVMYGEFVDHVALMRDLSTDAVRATEAKTFLPEKAIELGLAERVMTIEEFHDYLVTSAQSQGEQMFKRPSKFKLNKEENSEMNLAELQTQVAELQAKLEGSVAELSTKAEALQTLQTSLSEKEGALTAALSEVESLKAEKLEAKASARKQSLAAVLAADKVDSTAAALNALDDASFETVLSSYKAQAKVSKESDLMNELGGEGAALDTTVKAPVESETSKIIKQKLGTK